jgi:pseudouridine-5'-phosphate glycosidase
MTPRGLAETASPSAATEVSSTMIRAGTKSWSAVESGGIGGGTAPVSAA